MGQFLYFIARRTKTLSHARTHEQGAWHLPTRVAG